MSITPPLLDSLLTAQPAAEQHYHSIPVQTRVIDLTSLLVQHPPANAAEEARCLLAATLLRRDLMKCTEVSVAEPLLGLFEGCGSERVRRMVGRCVAELCGGEQWMGIVLKRLVNGVSAFAWRCCSHFYFC